MSPDNITRVDTDIERVLFNFLLARCGLSVLIVFGGGLTITALFSFKRLRSSPNCVILSLTLADLFGALLNPALVGLHYLQGHELWKTLCLTEETLDLIASGGAIISISLIALDRYLHVVKYLNYSQIVTCKRLIIAIICAWLYVGASSVSIIYFGEELINDSRCTWTLFTSRKVYYYVILPQIGMFFLVTVGFYVQIGHFVYKQRCEIINHRKASGQPPPPSMSRNSRTNKMISIVVCSHFTAAFPTLLLSAIVQPDSSVTIVTMQQAAILIWYAVAAANPVIYVWRNPDFRWAFRRLLGLPEHKDVIDTDLSSTKMTAATFMASTNNLTGTSSQKH